jgi:hypothetical protein
MEVTKKQIEEYYNKNREEDAHYYKYESIPKKDVELITKILKNEFN